MLVLYWISSSNEYNSGGLSLSWVDVCLRNIHIHTVWCYTGVCGYIGTMWCYPRYQDSAVSIFNVVDVLTF